MHGSPLAVLLAALAGSAPPPAPARPRAPVTAELANGISVAFLTETPAPEVGDGVVTRGSSDTVVRAFTDLAACTYFGYELRARALPDARIEVGLRPLGTEAEGLVRRYTEFVRAGCTRPRPLAAPSPRFPSPRVYADGESLSIALLANAKTGRVLADRIELKRSADAPIPVDRAALEREIESLRDQLRDKE